MEGFPPKPPNATVDSVKAEKNIEPRSATTGYFPFAPHKIIGEEKYNRLRELEEVLVMSEGLGEKELQEYYALNQEFMTALEISTETSHHMSGGSMDSVGDADYVVQDKTESVGFVKHPVVEAVGAENFNRLRELKRIRELLGGSLFGDEEKEYLTLESEFHDAYLDFQRNYANTAPSSIEFEKPVEIFTEHDVLKWKDGAHEFKKLSEILHDRVLQKKFETIFNPVDVNKLKALFLREKPAVLLEIPIDSNDSVNLAIVDLLKTFGIEVAGKYIYDKEQVRDMIKKHKDIFETLGSDDPDKVMDSISENKLAGEGHLIVGTLLGFPIESIKRFDKEEREEIKFSKRKNVNVYGISWVDFDDSLESKIKQARLKSAFEASGMLDLK
jgi:hypothetical protein